MPPKKNKRDKPSRAWQGDTFNYQHEYASGNIEVMGGPIAIMLRHCASNPQALEDLAVEDLYGKTIHVEEGYSQGVAITEILLPLCNAAQKDLWYSSLVKAFDRLNQNQDHDMDADNICAIGSFALRANDPGLAVRWITHTKDYLASQKDSLDSSMVYFLEAFLSCPGKTDAHIDQVIALTEDLVDDPLALWREAWSNNTDTIACSMHLPCKTAAHQMLNSRLFAFADVPQLLEDSMECCWLDGVLRCINDPDGRKHLEENLDSLLDPSNRVSIPAALSLRAQHNPSAGVSADSFKQSLELVDGLATQAPSWLGDRIRSTDFTPSDEAFPPNAAAIANMQMGWGTAKPCPKRARPMGRL